MSKKSERAKQTEPTGQQKSQQTQTSQKITFLVCICDKL